MRFAIGAALLAAMAVAGCVGPEGNPNKQAYATDPGGTVAVTPQAVGTVAYDPYAKAPSFADMDIGNAAIMPPPPPPMNLTPPTPTPRRPGAMPR